MTITTKDGKQVNVNNCGGAAQERMIKNGWYMKIRKNYQESPQELYDRCITLGYTKVKVYWTGTSIPGIWDYFAFVK